jgi:hypothetical protein
MSSLTVFEPLEWQDGVVLVKVVRPDDCADGCTINIVLGYGHNIKNAKNGNMV